MLKIRRTLFGAMAFCRGVRRGNPTIAREDESTNTNSFVTLPASGEQPQTEVRIFIGSEVWIYAANFLKQRF